MCRIMCYRLYSRWTGKEGEKKEKKSEEKTSGKGRKLSVQPVEKRQSEGCH